MFIQSENHLGAKASVINIRNEVISNQNFRKAVWTGEYLQVTVMSIPVGGEIGVEMHDNLDQLIKVESGCATVYMGKEKDALKEVGYVNNNYAILIPAGTWHNVVNRCLCPLKVFSIYAPPQHPFDTVHKTKEDADKSGD